MKFVRLLLLLSLLPAVGCGRRQRVDAAPRTVAQAGALKVAITLPKRVFVTGEHFLVTVTAENVSSKPLRIISRTGAPVYVRLWRLAGVNDWQEIKYYPQTATMLMTPWTIKGKSSRRFVIPLTVEPDWPTGEILSMTAEVNGRDDVTPRLTLEVSPPS